MENLLTVVLEAHAPERNRHRRYEVAVGRDLFGAWTVAVRYGRAARGGQERRYASPDPDGARAVVRTCLRRRLSAPRRIGCSYRLVRLDATSGFDPADWLPVDLLARLTVGRIGCE